MCLTKSVAAAAVLFGLAVPTHAMNLKLGSADDGPVIPPAPVVESAPSDVASETERVRRGAAGGPSMLGSPLVFTDAPLASGVPPGPPLIISRDDNGPVPVIAAPAAPLPSVPIPAAFYLLGGALMGLSLFRRRI